MKYRYKIGDKVRTLKEAMIDLEGIVPVHTIYNVPKVLNEIGIINGVNEAHTYYSVYFPHIKESIQGCYSAFHWSALELTSSIANKIK